MVSIERPAMSDYGVPSDPDGALPWSWARQRLIANRNFWVVTASAGGRPHAMPVWGVWLPGQHDDGGPADDGDGDRFWFSCSPNARKARNIAENPQCVVTVEDTVECVSVEGTARAVDAAADAAGMDAMVDAYLAKYWEDPSVHAEMAAFLRSHAAFVVTPQRAFGIIEREEEFAARATRWRW